MGCNLISPDDSKNFLDFLIALRAQVGDDFTLTAAAGITPFAGPDGTPMSDVSEFASALDWVAIMNYDVWGSWSPTSGPNAPLADACSPNPQGSATSAVKAWTDAGFPADQLVLGVAAYGHSFKVAQAAALAGPGLTLDPYAAFDKAAQPLGDSWDEVAPAGVDQCGNPSAGGPSGIFNFWGLVESGFLTATENGTAPAAGVDYVFDECSQTPFAYKRETGTMVSFDDARSFAAKGAFINDAGLLGFAMWEAAGDFEDVLLDAISEAIGIEEVGC